MKKVLIIDDDDIFEFLTKEFITEHYPQFEVKSYLSSVEGLEFLKTALKNEAERPDVLLLDIRMPEMDGFELLHELETDFKPADILPMKIFLLTSSLDSNDYRRSIETPMVSGFIGKPLDVEQLKRIFE